MKKIALDEEFSAVGSIYIFTVKDGKTILKKLREAGKSKQYSSPTIEEVRAFFKERGYTEESADKFHDYYSLGDWKDGNGKQVKNWKQKASSVWFKDTNKIKEKPEATPDKYLF